MNAVRSECSGGAPTSGRLLIWDFDGTIVDTFAEIRAVVGSVLAANNLRPVDAETLRQGVGLNLPALLRHTLSMEEIEPSKIEALAQECRQAFRSREDATSRVFPGIPRLLRDVHRLGLRSIIATSKGRNGVDPILSRFGFTPLFDQVICDDDVTYKKPEPEMVLAGCKRWGCDPGKALVIGDTIYDVQMGRAAGARTCAVTWGNHTRARLLAESPSFIVDNAAELRQVFANETTNAAGRLALPA